jgi:hypothetical protein
MTITVIHNSPEMWKIHMLDANIFKDKTKCGANIVHNCTFRESYMEREKIQQYHEYGKDKKKKVFNPHKLLLCRHINIYPSKTNLILKWLYKKPFYPFIQHV